MVTARELWRSITDAVQRLLFPVYCLRCGIEGEYLCDVCQGTVPPVPVQVCIFCSVASPNGRTCSTCQRHALDGVCARGFYDEWCWRALIVAWKFDNAAVGSLLASFFVTTLPSLPDVYRTGTYIVVPVPLGKRRLRTRGRNQAEELAYYIQAQSSLSSKILQRVRETAPQSQLSKQNRIRNVRGAFWADPKLVQPGAAYLLVDDVVTTGATLEEAARALKKAGAGTVWAVSLNRARLV